MKEEFDKMFMYLLIMIAAASFLVGLVFAIM
jgi:hypothetical protein